jgi:hypothetical protein
MANKKSQVKPTFYIQAKIHVQVALEVSANNLQEALEYAKNLNRSDFIEETTDSSIEDYEMKISGVFESYSELKP